MYILCVTRKVRVVGGLLVMVLLAGCALPGTCQNKPPSGPTSTANDGTLSITVDHIVYAPGDTIGITVTGPAGQPFYILYRCQQVLIGSPAEECPSREAGPPKPQISVELPGTNAVYLSATAPTQPGTYRLVVRYMLGEDPVSVGVSVPDPNAGRQLVSPPVRVCTCGRCS